jgi:hypothetical protein
MDLSSSDPWLLEFSSSYHPSCWYDSYHSWLLVRILLPRMPKEFPLLLLLLMHTRQLFASFIVLWFFLSVGVIIILWPKRYYCFFCLFCPFCVLYYYAPLLSMKVLQRWQLGPTISTTTPMMSSNTHLSRKSGIKEERTN